MSPILITVLAACVVLFVFLMFYLIGVYNSLVSLKNQIDRAWANIDVILKQRFDEIPQLIEVIEQYTQYEKGIIEKLVEARKHYGASKTVEDKINASKEMGQALQNIWAVGENYPELKTNNSIVQIQGRISDLESTLADRRELYNETVTNYNTRIEQFPDTIIASKFNFKLKTLFKVEEVEKKRPSLKMKLS